MQVWGSFDALSLADALVASVLICALLSLALLISLISLIISLALISLVILLTQLRARRPDTPVPTA